MSYLVQNRTKFCVFFELSGHVDWIRIRIAPDKENYNVELVETEFQLDGKYQQGDPLQPNSFLIRKRDILKKILKTEKIPFDDMVKEVIMVQQTLFCW